MLRLAAENHVGIVGIWVAALTLVGIFVRQVVPWRKAELESDTLFRRDLVRRVRKLEAQLERKEARHAARESLGNHKLRNITGCFDAMLLLLEMNPDRVPEIVSKIKEMRTSQMVAEAQEAAIIRATEIEADKELDAAEAADDEEDDVAAVASAGGAK